MQRPMKYIRKSDGLAVTALRYGNGGGWDAEAISNITSFVLGMQHDRHTTAVNERVLDIVLPILGSWDAANGKAPIMVSIPFQNDVRFRMELGDWLVRLSPQTFIKCTNDAITNDFIFVPAPSDAPELERIESLSSFIYNGCMTGLEGELYQALADGIAARLIRTGWSKKE